MKAYIGFDKETRDEAAMLIFAYSSREAKSLAYPTLRWFWGQQDWTDVRVIWLRSFGFYAERYGNVEKIAAGKPHVIDSPEPCPRCEKWGGEPLDDGCEFCEDWDEWN